MSANELSQYLETVRGDLRESEELDDFEPHSLDWERTNQTRVRAPTGVVAEVGRLLRHVELLGRFANEDGMVQVCDPSGSTGFRLEDFAEWLLAQVRLHGVDDPVKRLIQVARDNKGKGVTVFAFRGLLLKKKSSLGDGIVLAPLEQTPPSEIRDDLIYHPGGVHYMGGRPMAAVTLDQTWEPLLAKTPTTTPPRDGTYLPSIVNVLPVLTGAAVSFSGSWMHASVRRVASGRRWARGVISRRDRLCVE